MFITCEDQLPEYYGPTTFKWYTIEGEDDLQEVVEDERVFIDAVGKVFVFYPKPRNCFAKWPEIPFSDMDVFMCVPHTCLLQVVSQKVV